MKQEGELLCPRSFCMLHKPPGLVVRDPERSCLPWGGRLDPHALVETFAVYLVEPTVCLFKAGLLKGNKPWSQVFVGCQYTSRTTLLVVGIKLEE